MFIAALFTIGKIWKQPQCSQWMDGWIKKMWCIYNRTSAMRKKEILALATAWKDLEDVILSEIRPTETDKCCVISLIRGI